MSFWTRTSPTLMSRAMGASEAVLAGSLRFSLGTFSTDDEVDRVIAVVPGLVAKLRGLTEKSGKGGRS